MAKLPSGTDRDRPVAMRKIPAPGNVGFGQSIPNNGKAVSRQFAALPSTLDKGRPVKVSAGSVTSPTSPHISDAIREALPSLGSEKADRVRAVADRKR